MFNRILIANRGEIACRIARTCRSLGIEYVAVYSEPDAKSPHLQGAAVAVCLGPGPAAQSYLDINHVVQVGLENGCDAVHPGYGFLSENADFARAVNEAGMTFIGPLPETISAMGDKERAKRLMREAGVPVVPGREEATEDPRRIAELADEIGFPVLLKPVAGGGGKGMTVLWDSTDVANAVNAAVRLSRSSFGDGRLLVERFVERPRHIEVQIFGDDHGNIVHLYERECSLQRRHQKIIEEAPATCISESTREALRSAAVKGAQAIKYRNAGTFEFIVGKNDEFFFLEVNTRLQVEHPVTEIVTGLDLVEWQLRSAAGEQLPLSQEEIGCNGHAVECRIYAEDPADEFKPSPGHLLALKWPFNSRIDAGIVVGGMVSSFYDPMVAKIIVDGVDRRTALVNMRDALDDTLLLGLTTNVGFLRTLLSRPEVMQGEVDTGFVDARLSELRHGFEEGAGLACSAAMKLPVTSESSIVSPWGGGNVGPLDRGSLEPSAPFGLVGLFSRGNLRDARVQALADSNSQIEVLGEVFEVYTSKELDGVWRGTVNRKSWAGIEHQGAIELQIGGNRGHLLTAQAAEVEDDLGGNLAVSPMPAIVTAVLVEEGQKVAKGDVLIVVEAMKMETSVRAPASGAVVEVRCDVGLSVAANELLVVLGDESTSDNN